MNDQIQIAPCRRIEGLGRVPGDKSIAHRAVLVAMMNEGRYDLAGLPRALDVLSTVRAVRRLAPESFPQLELESYEPSTSTDDFQLLGDSYGLATLQSPDGPIDVGNSGTTIRLLMGILAGGPTEATLTGDDSIRRRPMGRVVDPLRAMGADVTAAEGGVAPIVVRPAPLTGMEHVLPVASAQVKSALLLAGLAASGRTSVVEPGPSRDHTERLLAHAGVPVDISTDRRSVSATHLSVDLAIDVPKDLSAAAFLLVAAAITPGSEVTIGEVGLNPTRTGILDVLGSFGAAIDITDEREVSGEPRGTLRLRSDDRRALTVEGDLTVRAIDELPLVAVLGAYAEGVTTVADAGELRVKESDRIGSIVSGLAALGVAIEPTPDGFTVRGGPTPSGGSAASMGDHRIAMALAVAALGAAGPSTIDGWSAADVSYPGFARALDAVAVR